MTVIERLREKANSLPRSPGVYIMKDAEGRVIYVGKSKKLKNRVTSYFVSGNHSYKTERMGKERQKIFCQVLGIIKS